MFKVEEHRQESISWARRVLALDDFRILDTETTGLNDGEICSIAIINKAGETLLNTLVKTAQPIPPAAMRIHGITNEMVFEAPTFPLLAVEIERLLSGRDVVVYNATYDRKMLHKSAERWGMDKIDWKTLSPWHCAMEAFARFYGEWNEYHGNYKWQRLSTAARYFGLSTDGAHDALADCLMTLGVIRGMAEAGNEENG